MTNKCVILGAYGGIGSVLAKHLNQQGWELVLVGRNQDKLQQLSEEMGSLTTSSAIDPCDIEAVDQALSENLGFTAIVNCVGSVLLKPAHRTTTEEWQATLLTNLNSSFAAVRAGAKYLPRGGSVLCYSSAAASTGLPNHEAIAAAKAGVEGLVRSAAASYAAKGIRFNCVAPGLVKTPMTQFITDNETALKASEQMHALGRIGEAEDIVAMSTFLISDQASWVTGQSIHVDGGLCHLKPPVRARV